MPDRLSRSSKLIRASAAVLRGDKQLLLFPLISLTALLAVLASFAVPLFPWQPKPDGSPPTRFYVLGFLFYYVQFFVILFFNSALVAAALKRLDGEPGAFFYGLRAATSRLVVIAIYAFISATVGIALRALEEKVEWVGKIAASILGAAWGVATFLVIPLMIDDEMQLGPIEALKESVKLLRDTWGENVIAQVGLGSAFGAVHFLIGIIGIGCLGLGDHLGSDLLRIAGAAWMAVAFILTLLVQSALTGIYEAALYRYATMGEGTMGFDEGTLKAALEGEPT